jgi:hypothetical protein
VELQYQGRRERYREKESKERVRDITFGVEQETDTASAQTPHKALLAVPLL